MFTRFADHHEQPNLIRNLEKVLEHGGKLKHLSIKGFLTREFSDLIFQAVQDEKINLKTLHITAYSFESDQNFVR